MKNIHLTILFEPRDLWVGVFWDATYMWNHYDYEAPKKMYMITLRIFITIIPMLPLRIVVDVQPLKAYLSRLLTTNAADDAKCARCGNTRDKHQGVWFTHSFVEPPRR